jgi:hypothetical protein
MAKYLKSKQPAQKSVKQNNSPAGTPASLRRVRRNIYRQAALAVLTIVLTIVILFAMTSAWYTNIVQSSGLTFEAEAWGFNGTIEVSDLAIKAAPGDDGIVNLTVKNESDTISAISINVSKNEMSADMQKRLYFYVDTRMNRNGETMDRVYLNRYEGYTYNVFNKGQLTLTEQISNAPVIKWEWVYDVLGYYVIGQSYEVPVVDTVTNEDGSTTPTVVGTVVDVDVREYLRPIEYNYDEATTVINKVEKEDGTQHVTVELDTVDGTISPEKYLVWLSKLDGYEGEINPENKRGDYYVVDVDEETGYGVYAYLCNYSEIQAETRTDTEMGDLAYRLARQDETLTDAEKAKLRHKAILTLSAQKNESSTINVTTLSSLQNAITNGYADVVQLSSNITIPADSSLTIPENSEVMLDLNGHTISNVSGTAIKAEPGSSLTMINGSLVQNAQEQSSTTEKTYGIYATGAEVVMSKVDINDFRYGIYMGDNENSNELDSRVHMVGCNINAETYAVFISGNGQLSDQKSQLIIESSELSSTGIVITGNGDTSGKGRWGTDIQIINSKIFGKMNDQGVYGGGIYQPQKGSTLTVYKSYVEGYNGITVKGGHVRLIDADIIGLGAYNEPSFEGSGYTDTGDAVYIETNYGYDIQLEISEGSILNCRGPNTDKSQSLRVYEAEATNVLIQIESGKFDEEQPAEYIAEGSAQTVAVDGKATVTSPDSAT